MNNDFKNDDIRDLIVERDGYLEQVKELEQELQRKDNIINECAEEILKELETYHHLSYGVALSIRKKLLDYKELGNDN